MDRGSIFYVTLTTLIYSIISKVSVIIIFLFYDSLRRYPVYRIKNRSFLSNGKCFLNINIPEFIFDSLTQIVCHLYKIYSFKLNCLMSNQAFGGPLAEYNYFATGLHYLRITRWVCDLNFTTNCLCYLPFSIYEDESTVVECRLGTQNHFHDSGILAFFHRCLYLCHIKWWANCCLQFRF